MISCHFKQYCSGIYCRTGVNCYWIIHNSQQVLLALNTINYFSTVKHFDSYDFSVLYTSIPRVSLKHALSTLIKEAYILVVDNTNWSDKPSRISSGHSLTEVTLTIYVEYLVDNIYVHRE